MNKLQKSLIVFIILFLITRVILSDWFKKTFPTEFMASLVIHYSLYFNVILFSIFIVFIYLNRKLIFQPLRNMDKKKWLILILILFLSLYLRIGLSPLYDPARSGGWEYNLMAKGYIETGDYDLCIVGSFDDCDPKIIPDHTPGFAFVLTFLFMIFGINGSLAIATNILAGVLVSLVVFLITAHLFKNKKTALWSAFIMAILPIHIIYSGTGEVTSILLFIISCAFLSIVVFIRNQAIPSLCLSLLTILMALNFQITNAPLFLIFIVAVLLFVNNKIVLDKSKQEFKRYIIPTILGFIVMIPYAQILTQPVAFSEGIFLSLNYFSRNFSAFLFENQGAFSITILLVFIIGIFSFRNSWKEKLLVLIWGASYLGFYLLLFSPHMERYTVDLYPVIVIFASLGIVYLIKQVNKFWKQTWFKKYISIILIFILLFSSIPFNIFFSASNNLHNSFSEYSQVWWANTELISEIVNDLPDDVIIIVSTDAEARKLFFETNNKIIPGRLIFQGDWSKYLSNEDNFVLLKTTRFYFEQKNLDLFVEYFNLEKKVRNLEADTIEIYYK